MALAFNTDGLFLATGSRDKSVKVWDVRTVRQHRSVSEDFGFVPSIAFHKDVVAFGDWFGSLRLWNVTTGELRLIGDFGRAIYGVAFSSDGRLLASAGYDHQLRLWDATTGAPLHVFRGHTKPVRSAAFSPDGRRLVSASADYTFKLWGVPGN